MSDEHVIAVVRSSDVYRAADAMLRMMEVAWRGSTTRGMLDRVAAERVRFWSIAALTASAMALVVAPLGTDPRPLAWLVPSGVGAVSLLLLLRSPR